jgi:hypothetical protein
MPRRKSGVSKQEEPKPLTLAAHLPGTPEELQPRVATMTTELAADKRFAALAPEVTQTQTDNTALGNAIVAATNGGEIETRAVSKADTQVRQDVRELVPKVQGILRGLAPAEVPGILATLLLYQSHIGQRPPKAAIAAQDPKGGASWSVLLVALAIAGALYYEYDWSTDQATWVAAGKSGKSRFLVQGLTPGKQYWFRVSAFLRDGTTTQPVVIAKPFIVR